MEAFSLTAAAGWQKLSALLAAHVPAYTGQMQWQELTIRNTHAANTLIVKPLNGSTAPAVDSGFNLGVGDSQTWQVGPINGENIWIKASGAGTTLDVSFTRYRG